MNNYPAIIKSEIDDFSLAGLKPGKYLFELTLFQLIDGSDVTVKVGVLKGKSSKGEMKRPICITGAQHGDEWTGPYVCHQLFRSIKPENVDRDVLLVPVANPLAFREAGRVSSIDSIDMNRVYGSGKKRKPTEHIANEILETIYLKSDLLVDIHSGGPGEYLLLAQVADETALSLASRLGFENIVMTKKHSFSLGSIMQSAGRATLTIECGKAREINRPMADRLIRHLKKLIHGGKVGIRSTAKTQIYQSVTLVGSPASGIFTSAVELGDVVRAGRKIGAVTPLMSDQSVPVTAPVSGKVIYLRREPFTGKNESLAHVVSQALR